MCQAKGIEHRPTKPSLPWTNGQAGRMSCTIKKAPLKALPYPDFVALKAHVRAFVTRYNFARPPKSLRWKIPFDAICNARTQAMRFELDPYPLIPGPGICATTVPDQGLIE
ncbi:integrase core domain-containing protein [Azotobacter armeniacus]